MSTVYKPEATRTSVCVNRPSGKVCCLDRRLLTRAAACSDAPWSPLLLNWWSTDPAHFPTGDDPRVPLWTETFPRGLTGPAKPCPESCRRRTCGQRTIQSMDYFSAINSESLVDVTIFLSLFIVNSTISTIREKKKIAVLRASSNRFSRSFLLLLICPLWLTWRKTCSVMHVYSYTRSIIQSRYGSRN